MSDPTRKQLRQFNGPRIIEKTMHTLHGIVRGVTIDRKLNDDEIAVLACWLGENKEFRDRHPFTEVVPRLERIINDHICDEEERADILWFCEQFTTHRSHFDQVTGDLQILHGIMGGIAADAVITEDELKALRDWMDDKQHLRGCWPFDEIDSLLTSVMADGKIDPDEHEMMLNFFADVLTFLQHKSLHRKELSTSPFVGGVCATDPQIRFEGKRFCFTGTPDRGPKRQLQKEVTDRDGLVEKSVIGSLDYLIIGAKGNECWAYSAYGRKVERAIELRRAGKNLMIVHEFDFWDAVED